MTKLELLEIITNGENSAVEFKRDTVKNTDLAEEIVAFSNTEGGMILLGVEDDGQIIGTTRADIEEWLMNICSQSVIPAVIPHFERIRVDEGKCVVVLRVPKGVNKPLFKHLPADSTSGWEQRSGWSVRKSWHAFFRCPVWSTLILPLFIILLKRTLI
ncbi:AlbA family DNA-binding domain-containing protein [Thermincola ferriacetica]